MTNGDPQSAPPKRPDWVKVGAWVRPTNAHYMGVAFITFLTDTGFKYHFAKPWKTHVRDEGWQVGGESFTTDWWEPCSSPLSETLPPKIVRLLRDWSAIYSSVDDTRQTQTVIDQQRTEARALLARVGEPINYGAPAPNRGVFPLGDRPFPILTSMTFESDCVVNGELIAAGTTIYFTTKPPSERPESK